MAEGVNKGKIYGLGVQPSSIYSLPLLFGASTCHSPEEIYLVFLNIFYEI